MTEQTERLLQLAEFLDALPDEQFNFDSWVSRDGGHLWPPASTVSSEPGRPPMHRPLDDRTARTACEAPEEEAYRARLKAEAEELLRNLNQIMDRLEGPPYYREDALNLGEFIEARQYLSLLQHAEDVFKHYHELLDFAEGTAGDNKGRPWDWIEKAKAVVFKAEGNT